MLIMEEIDRKFAKAYEVSSAMKEKLPPDTMLKLYAYYKQATKGTKYTKPSGENEIRNAFKLNAWFQINTLSEEEAKRNYITLVEEITNQKIE